VITGEFLCGVVVTAKTCACAHPETSLAVLEKTGDNVAAQRRSIVAVVEIGFEIIAVVAIQTVVGGYPHVAVFILTHIVDKCAGETLGGNEYACLTENQDKGCMK
jgi:hypothetical protein